MFKFACAEVPTCIIGYLKQVLPGGCIDLPYVIVSIESSLIGESHH